MNWEQIYTSPLSDLGKGNAEFEADAASSFEPDEFRARTANMGFFQSLNKVDPEAVEALWPTYRGELARSLGHDKPVESDVELFGLVGQHFTAKKAERDAYNAYRVSMFTAAAEGAGRPEYKGENQLRRADIAKEWRELELSRERVAPLVEEFRMHQAKEGSMAERFATEFETAAGAGTAGAMAERLAEYSPLDRAMFFKLAEKAKAPESPQATPGRRIERGVIKSLASIVTGYKGSDIAGTVEALKEEAPIGGYWVNPEGRVLPKGLIPGGAESSDTALQATGWLPATPEQIATARAEAKKQADTFSIRRQLEDVYNNQVDPATFNNWVADALADAPAQAGYLAMGLIPAAGPVLLMESIRGQRLDEMVSNGIPLEQAETLSRYSAAVEMPLDWLQANLAFGGLVRKAVRSGPTVLRAASAITANFGEQFAQEIAQDATPLVVQEIASRLGMENVPETVAAQWKEYIGNMPQTAVTLMPLALIGGGVATTKTHDFAQEYLSNPMILEGAGLSPTAVEAITTIARQDPAEALAMIAGEYESGRVDPATSTAVAARANLDTLMREDSVLGAPMPNAPRTELSRPSDVVGEVSRRKAIQSVENVLTTLGAKVPVRVGKMGQRMRKALGFFHPRQNLIRIREAEDLSTIAHELGHAYEFTKFEGDIVGTKALSPGMITELTTLGRELYGAQNPTGGYAREGLAEYFRLKVSDPEVAAKKAPKFDTWFREDLSQDKVLEEAFRQAQKDVTLWFRQGAVSRGRGGIVPMKSQGRKALDYVAKSREDFITNFVDRFAIVREFGRAAESAGITLKEGEDPYAVMTARNMTADETVRIMATEAMLDFNHNIVPGVKPLAEAFKLVGDANTQNFLVYLWARRARKLWDSPDPRNPGMTSEDAAQIITELDSPQFQEAARIWYEWHDAVLDYAAGASPDMAEVVKIIRRADVGDYIPLQREFDSFTKKYLGSGGVKGKELVKRLRGSGRSIKDPVESALTGARAMVLKAHQKRVFDLMLSLAERVPDLGWLITKVPENVTAYHPTVQAAVEAIEAATGEDVSRGLNEDQLGALATFWMPATQQKSTGAPVMQFWRKGKVETYELDRRLYEAFNTMTPAETRGAISTLIAGSTRVMRTGTTGLALSFNLVKNPLRDLRTLIQQTQSHANPAELLTYYMESLTGRVKTLSMGAATKDDWARVFESLGINLSQTLMQDTPSLKRAASLVKQGGEKRTVRDGWDVIRSLISVSESAARMAEVKAVAKDMGWNPSMPLTPEVYTRLAVAGKQVTTDFTQAGLIARRWNLYSPFYNASIQGTVAAIRAAKANPTRFVLRGLAFTALTVANWLANKDDEGWKQLTAAEKYRNTYIKVGSEWLKIPRAFELDGAFTSMPEAMLDAWYNKDPEAATLWAQQFLGNVVPFPGLPPLVEEAAEQISNLDFFTRRPILSMSDANRPREEQVGPYTTVVAQRIGEITGASPKRVDHAIRGLFGSVGGDITALFGRAAGLERDWELADIPVAGVLFQRGGQYAPIPKAVDDLFDLADEMRRRHGSVKNPETPEQRGERLVVEDAVRAVVAARWVQQHTVSREARQTIEDEVLQIAKDAISPDRSAGYLARARRQYEAERKQIERTTK